MQFSGPNNAYPLPAIVSLAGATQRLLEAAARKRLLLAATTLLNGLLLVLTAGAGSYGQPLNDLLAAASLETNKKFYEWLVLLKTDTPLFPIILVMSIAFLLFVLLAEKTPGRAAVSIQSKKQIRLVEADSTLSGYFSVSYFIHFACFAFIALSAISFVLPQAPDRITKELQIVLCRTATPESEASENYLSSNDHQPLKEANLRLIRKAEQKSDRQAFPTLQSLELDRVSCQTKRKTPSITPPQEKQVATAPPARSAKNLPPQFENGPSSTPPETGAGIIETGKAFGRMVDRTSPDEQFDPSRMEASVAVNTTEEGRGTAGLIQAQLAADSAEQTGRDADSLARHDAENVLCCPHLEQAETLVPKLIVLPGTTNYRLPPNIVPTPEKGKLLREWNQVPITDLSNQIKGWSTTGRADGRNDNLMDAELSDYLANLTKRIKRHWFPPRDGLVVKVVFKLDACGYASILRIVQSGGSLSDQAALRAVNQATPFGSLPAELAGCKSPDIEFTFDYNLFNSRMY
jgi:outer membrane biosynthesis protein TonB